MGEKRRKYTKEFNQRRLLIFAGVGIHIANLCKGDQRYC